MGRERTGVAVQVSEALGYGGEAMAILPPKEPKTPTQKEPPTSVNLPRWMKERLDGLAASRNYRSRSEVILRLLEWAIEELDREERKRPQVKELEAEHARIRELVEKGSARPSKK